MAATCPRGHGKSHLGFLQDPAIYLACNWAPFTIPANELPHYPVVLAGATTHQCKELTATNVYKRKAWMTYPLVLAITRNQFAATIKNIYYAILNDPIKGLNMLITHITRTYVQINQLNLDNNLINFNAGINPSLPLTMYTRTQSKCQVLLSMWGSPSPMPQWSQQAPINVLYVAT
jgi:hypothetical protein